VFRGWEKESFEGVTWSDLCDLPLRDPEGFVAGELGGSLGLWDTILSDHPRREEILGWLEKGVEVSDFFKRFKGQFRGQSFDQGEPPVTYMNNSSVCREHVQFVERELQNRIDSGALKVLGRVGECVMPRVILPLTVEPTKPRLVLDCRFVNLWMRDEPFQLENLKEVPRLVYVGDSLVTCDEKSGYDHVGISEESRKFFGVQFGGWVMLSTTIPFGWKISAFVYQTVGLVATSFLRQEGMSLVQYIDDRLLVIPRSDLCPLGRVKKCLWLMTDLGYTVSVKKSSLWPLKCVRFLGMEVDSEEQVFRLPEDKRVVFLRLREDILAQDSVDIRTMQRWVGKCVSVMLAVPAARLFTVQGNLAIGKALRSSKLIRVGGVLREEIEAWSFLERWNGRAKWRLERHVRVEMVGIDGGRGFGFRAGVESEVVDFDW
jgi:hypothetical protein